MNVDGKLIAIIGPNEAGKSSFLKALLRINDRDPIVQTGGSQELSRGVAYGSNHSPIELTYLLEPHDLNALGNVPGTESSRWFTIQKRLGGNYYIDISPRPVRPLQPRTALVAALKKYLGKIQKEEEQNVYKPESGPLVESLINELSTDAQTLDEEITERIADLSKAFLGSGIASKIEPLQKIAKDLDVLAEEESKDLHNIAANILFNRRPEFLLFDPQELDLKSEYDLNALEANVPMALANLVNLAEMNLSQLFGLVKENDQGQIETVTRRVNERLAKVFADAWSQSKIEVVFRVSGSTLSILVGEQDSPYVKIAERSDGLRRYIALLSFMKLKATEQRPILLIDEAETHLHYDAQADLVQMLARQDLASKVIYTTHSIGCLPEDLGSGVRQVETLNDGFSRVQNWFWESGGAGFSPLLYGMGAETMAFIPIRYALIAEGAADMILLPCLLREASSRTFLGFQIVPGLSEADENRIIQLENTSSRTAFLVDADKAGKGLVKQLKRANVDKSRIFSLPDPAKEGLVIEDFVDENVYIEAMNEELHRSHGNLFKISSSDLSPANRPASVVEWCKKNKIKPPSKRAVAYRILERSSDNHIVNNNRAKGLVKMLSDLHSILGIVE